MRRLSPFLKGSAGICACHGDQLKENDGTLHNKCYASPAFPFLLWNWIRILRLGELLGQEKELWSNAGHREGALRRRRSERAWGKSSRDANFPFLRNQFTELELTIKLRSNWWQFDDFTSRIRSYRVKIKSRDSIVIQRRNVTRTYAKQKSGLHEMSE